jgi:hypothetical protein
MSGSNEGVPEKIVQYEEGVTEYKWDVGVTGFTVKPGVTTISERAFFGCWNLRSLNGLIGSNVTKVEEYAFAYCRSLESLEGLPSELEEIGVAAFVESGIASLIGLPKVEEITQLTFYNTRITTLEGLSRNLKRIGMYAFCGCPLNTLTSLPDSVTTLHPEAFGSSIQDFTRIGSYSFSSCSSLRSAMYHFQESNRFRSSLRFWIASLKRRGVTKLETHPSATPEFVDACNFLLEMHWCEIGEIEELICSYLAFDIDETLLKKYVDYYDASSPIETEGESYEESYEESDEDHHG